MSAQYLRILKDVVNLPTAPFVEKYVIQYIHDFVARYSALSLRTDKFGNILVTYRPSTRAKQNSRPILLAAHMDHPGMIARKMLDKNRLQADWRGWVQSSYFLKQSVQFFSDGRWVPGVIEEVIAAPAPKSAGKKKAPARQQAARGEPPPAGVIVRSSSTVEPDSPGMWRIPDAIIKDKRLFARACDDVAGLAAILCALDALCRKKAKYPCYAFFTRAEEVGFAGALAAVQARTVPQKALVVAVECSKAITGVGVGAGPVLRVGDRASVFTPTATTYCQIVAEQLAVRDKSFAFQRKLMDGGTCESTAYCHYGYEATGICLPLVNYHNMDLDRKRIGPESVHIDDYLNLIKWFVALVESPATMKFDGKDPRLDERLEKLLKENRPRLLETAARNNGRKSSTSRNGSHHPGAEFF